mmetsp:Transcript_78251/g.253448  ORF Transcript_78251/g.253448 Transcript_78251/m.253448 type:complete len:250 (+) Transcript_78251:536-1285(+)
MVQKSSPEGRQISKRHPRRSNSALRASCRPLGRSCISSVRTQARGVPSSICRCTPHCALPDSLTMMWLSGCPRMSTMLKESCCRPVVSTSRTANTNSMRSGTTRSGHRVWRKGAGLRGLGPVLCNGGKEKDEADLCHAGDLPPHPSGGPAAERDVRSSGKDPLGSATMLPPRSAPCALTDFGKSPSCWPAAASDLLYSARAATATARTEASTMSANQAGWMCRAPVCNWRKALDREIAGRHHVELLSSA